MTGETVAHASQPRRGSNIFTLPLYPCYRGKLRGWLVHPIADRLGPSAEELLAVWSLLPKRDHVPDRQNFDPMAIARILPVISLLQRIADEEWRIRLVGTELERRWGRRLTGCNYTEIVTPGIAAVMRAEFEEIVRRPCGSRSVRRVELGSGRLATIENVRLPLRAKDGSVSLILSCSEEVTDKTVYERDPHRAIMTVVEQRFIDIGAGVSTNGEAAGATWRRANYA